MVSIPTWYFVMALYLSLFWSISLDFYAFRKQFKSILAKLGTGEQANQIDVEKTVCELIKFHVFIKE